MRAIEADVLVIGAGPAGTTFALNLAPTRRVVLVDALAGTAARIGESLAPAARRLFADMGLWEDFCAQGHAPCHGGRSLWGGPVPTESGALRDLDGPGWHLDRGRFDGWLRGVAASRGAAVLAPARPLSIEPLAVQPLAVQSPLVASPPVEHGCAGWRVELAVNGRRVPLTARLLVDAGGRGSTVARRFGARRHARDRLACGWVRGAEAPGRQSGVTLIEAEPDGWWYAAPLPGGGRVAAFHVDADSPAAADARNPAALLRRMAGLSMIPATLAANGFVPSNEGSGFCAAHSCALTPPVGPGWLAVGDAALGFDPLSSQGIFNALYTGLAAAEAADRHLNGDAAALNDYAGRLQTIHQAYRRHLAAWYGLERRWPDRPFWARRLFSAEMGAF